MSTSLDQSQIDDLVRIGEMLNDTDSRHSAFVREMHKAILDSGRLSAQDWLTLRDRLREIEELIPHIDYIVKLKQRYKAMG